MSPPSLPSPGERIGPYLIEAVLGRGGMAAAYRARHVETGACHAVKVVLPEVVDGADDAVARFLREAALLARVPPHEGVVGIHAHGRDGGLAWLAMDLAPGRSLASLLEAGPLGPREAAQLLERLAEAVAHVHRAKIVHRDIKPQNVIVTDDGRPRLVDFGLAFIPAVTRLTAAGAVLGTPAYMAPEQIEAGETGAEPGPSVDVWALGGVLYAALTGRPPFSGALQRVLLDVITKDPDRPSRLAPGVPPELDAVCLRALEKAPRRRYPTAAALRDDLRRWLDGEPVAARLPSLAARVGRFLVRRRLRLVVAATVAFGLLAAGTFLAARAMLARSPQKFVNDALATLEGGRRLERSERDAIALIGREHPELASEVRVVELLAALLAATREEPAAVDELGAFLRAEDAAFSRTAQRILALRAQWHALDAVLHGSEPVLPVETAVEGVRVARPLAEEMLEGRIEPPRDARVLARLASTLDPAEAASLRLIAAQRRLVAGDATASGDFHRAWPIARERERETAVPARWPATVREALAGDLGRRLARGEPLRVGDAFLAERLELSELDPEVVTDMGMTAGRGLSDEKDEAGDALERAMVAIRFLMRHGYSPGYSLPGPGLSPRHAEAILATLGRSTDTGADDRPDAGLVIACAGALAHDLAEAQASPRREHLLHALATVERVASDEAWLAAWVAFLRFRICFQDGDATVGKLPGPGDPPVDEIALDLVEGAAERALELDRARDDPRQRWAGVPSALAWTLVARDGADVADLLRALELVAEAEGTIHRAGVDAGSRGLWFAQQRRLGPRQVAVASARLTRAAIGGGKACCASGARDVGTVLDEVVRATGDWPTEAHGARPMLRAALLEGRAGLLSARASHRRFHGDEEGAREDEEEARQLLERR